MVKNQEQKRIYLACPYSDSSPLIRQERYNLATQMAAALMKQGHSVFSPITQGHHICEYGIEHGFNAWKNTDLSIVELWATEVYVLMLDGFEESKGVQAEIEYAKELKLHIFYLSSNKLHPPTKENFPKASSFITYLHKFLTSSYHFFLSPAFIATLFYALIFCGLYALYNLISLKFLY